MTHTRREIRVIRHAQPLFAFVDEVSCSPSSERKPAPHTPPVNQCPDTLPEARTRSPDLHRPDAFCHDLHSRAHATRGRRPRPRRPTMWRGLSVPSPCNSRLWSLQSLASSPSRLGGLPTYPPLPKERQRAGGRRRTHVSSGLVISRRAYCITYFISSHVHPASKSHFGNISRRESRVRDAPHDAPLPLALPSIPSLCAPGYKCMLPKAECLSST